MKAFIWITILFSSYFAIAANSYEANLNLNGQNIRIVGLAGRVHCDWNTSLEPPHFTVLIEGKDEELFFELEGFNHNLMTSGPTSFDFRKPETSPQSIAIFEHKSSGIRYNLDMTEQKSNCVVDLKSTGLDVAGTFSCSNLDKYENDKLVGNGFFIEGTFSCPYSNS